MKRVLLFCAVLLSAAVPAVAAKRIMFERIAGAAHPLRSIDDIAVVHSGSENEGISVFIATLVDQGNRSGFLHLRDGASTAVESPTVKPRRRRTFPAPRAADVLLRIGPFECRAVLHSGEGSSRDFEGNRVRRKLLWIDAACDAYVEAVRQSDSFRLFAFDVRGEGTSPRVEAITPEESRSAIDQAARHAAITAAAEFTPRSVRESIELDQSAPEFEDGMAMIEGNQLGRARQIWEIALQRNPSSASLHFNLAAVCEAIGDVACAESHFATARALAPAEPRFRQEENLFRRRNGLKTIKAASGRP